MRFCGFFVFIACLLANLIQLINYLTIRYVSIDYYRRINAWLQYFVYSQFIAITEWWSKSSVTIYAADEATARMFGKEHAFIVANHRYEVDAVFMWLVSNKFNVLGGCKAFGKKDLRYTPIIGWTFFFGEYIFLERNWQKDSMNIGSGIDRLMAHKHPVILMIAAEGTRFTAQKYETSMKFAADRQLGVHYNHHLLPRVKDPECAIYCFQMAFDETRESIKVSTLFKGQPMHCSIHLKRVSLSTVPTDTDEQITQYLYDLFTEKDQLMDYYYKNKSFPGIKIPTKRTFTGIYLTINSARISKGSTYGTINGKESHNVLTTGKSSKRDNNFNASPKED
ncbi:unnamed protein product [Medioppia subpectinata]|uniref:Phospholipid/glycerol acyltransferase domain-containing protein n=1 Tax=Medioppia subpectinata TaxID=1979941 RepID=A0A7R9L1Q7_9ACAR|nr:unnamed protein product [Medioppia subpectinata]CAG2113735.1 unnamed protein product [Medioppia subpectinata]